MFNHWSRSDGNDQKPLSLDIQASTFANLTGNPSEKRNITSLTSSELKFNRPFVKGVTLEAVFKRTE